MKHRKGIGYMVEVITAMLVMFVFILGNTATQPETDWSSFQKKVVSQDLTYILEKSGDAEDFIRNGETGSLVTAASALSRERVEVSGTVQNVPISTQTVGFHTLPSRRYNISIQPESGLDESTDRCYDSNDLEEINNQDGEIHRSLASRGKPYLYIADTDPEIAGGDGDIDYDTLYIDNRTRCQFAADEGPYYIEEIFYWGNRSQGPHYDINSIYSQEKELELYNATQVADLKNTLSQRVNGIDASVEVDTLAAEKESLAPYSTLVFRKDDTLSTINSNRKRIEQFISDRSILLMMDLERTDFYDGTGLEDNFLTSTGLKWIDLTTQGLSDPTSASFSSNPNSRKLQTYFQGMNGDTSAVNLEPGGKISSSNSRSFKQRTGILSTSDGSYETDEWNATNYNMNQVDPDSVSEPKTACVDDSQTENLTEGDFSFPDYQTGTDKIYSAISVKMAKQQSDCTEDIRAVMIDTDDSGAYEKDEGLFLQGEKFRVENKTYSVNFPDQEARETGDAVEFVYRGDKSIEMINYRTGFKDFEGRKLARMEYKQDYSEEEEKMIASTIHWLSDTTKQFGRKEQSTISTEIVAGVKEQTFIPYRIALRWR